VYRWEGGRGELQTAAEMEEEEEEEMEKMK